MKLALALALLASRTVAAEWAQYRGPNGDGSTTEKIAAWPATGAKELWRVKLGTGLSSVTVAAGRVFSAGYKDGNEVLQCMDAKNGTELWAHPWPAKLGNYLFEGGPRATPTVDGQRVFMVGADGYIACVEASSGEPVWSKNLVRDFGGKRMDWGFSCSPKIDGDNVLLDCGGQGASTIALNKKTGDLVWKAGDDEPGYGSVEVAEIDGKRTAIVLKAAALVGHDPNNGTVLWRHDWPTPWKANAATPLVVGDLIIISSAYNHGAAAIRVKDGKAEQVWFTKKLMAHFNSPVHREGAVFAIHGEVGKKGTLVCLDAKTGDQKWSNKDIKNGSLILAGDKLLVLTEVGELILAEANSTAYMELGRGKVLGGRCWIQPVLADGVVYCKNNAGELVALSLEQR